MLFTIKEIEAKQSASGTKYARCTILNDKGKEYSNVTVFGVLADKQIGEIVSGELTSNDYQGKVGWKFLEERTNTLNRGTGIAKAQEAKRKDIAVAQENRAEGVKIASTFKDATLVTIEEMRSGEFTDGEFQKSWLKWRSWLWSHWDDEQEPF